MATGVHELVGRDEELGILAEFLDGAAGTLLLEGEAGIGKTTLWRRGIKLARERGYRVLAAAPAASEAQLAYTAVRDLLEELFEVVEADLPAPQRRALGVALLRTDPRGRPPGQEAVAAGFVSALRISAHSSPVLVAIDDVQWLDASSALVVGFAARRLREERIAFLLACRADVSEPLPLELDRTLAPGRITRLRLGPLSVGALSRLLQVHLGRIVSRPMLIRLHETSGGNAFFVLELARALDPDTTSVAPGEPLPVPPNLLELVLSRLAALPRACEEPLLAAAALSTPTLALVEAATSPPPGALEAAFEERVIELTGERIRFEHPLVASAVYRLATPLKRRALHARLAQVVTDVEERARHLALASAAPDAEVAAALDEACQAVAARGASADAAELAEEARRLTPPIAANDLGVRTLRAADWRLRAGETRRARKLLTELVETSPPGPERAHGLLRLARLEMLNHEFGVAVDHFRAALAVAKGDLRLRVEAEDGLGWAFLLDDREAAAEPHARAAVSLAEHLGDAQTLAEELALLGIVQFYLGRGVPHELVERALALERWTPGLRVLRHPAYALGSILARADELGTARQHLGDLHRRALEHGDESAVSLVCYQLGLVSLAEGALEEALHHVDAGYEAALLADQKPQRAFLLALRALIEAHRGEEDAARGAAERARTAAGPARAARAMRTATWALGLLELSLARVQEAHGLLAPITEWARRAGFAEPANAPFVPDEIEALIALGRLDDAAALLGDFEARAEAVGRRSALAASARCRGLLHAARGEVENALSAFKEALDLHAHLGQPFGEARTLLTLGATQRRAMRKREARDSLQKALDAFERLGARLWGEQARAEIARISGRVASRDELTPSEERVAEFVAEGMTNREIAAALYISPKTVEFHLRHIYAKLGIRTRTQLARRLERDTAKG